MPFHGIYGLVGPPVGTVKLITLQPEEVMTSNFGRWFMSAKYSSRKSFGSGGVPDGLPDGF